jgi:hypothetical protein
MDGDEEIGEVVDAAALTREQLLQAMRNMQWCVVRCPDRLASRVLHYFSAVGGIGLVEEEVPAVRRNQTAKLGQ